MGDLEQQIKERIEQNEARKQTLVIFGRDVTKIPCFKSSLFTGILSGVGAGILVFMFTSRPQLASHSMLGGFAVTTLGYYSICRYQFAKEAVMVGKMKGLMNEAMKLEGIEKDEKIEEVTKLIDV